MSTAVNNADADLVGKTLMAAENAETITGLKSFSRSTAAPFAVNSGAAVVTNLDSDKLDGVEGADYARLSTNNALAAVQTAAAQPRCGVYSAATQAVSDATATAATFDTEDHDVGGCHEGVTNPSRLTAPNTGLYLATAHINFPGDADGYRRIHFRKNGTTVVGGGVQSVGVASVVQVLVLSIIVPLTANDYLEAMITHTAGNSLTTGDASTRQLQNSAEFVKLW